MMPKSLRRWFIIHFIVDMLFAIPLLFFPHYLLSFLGWTAVEPFTARLVGAALFSIGGVSLWMNKEGKESYSVMLRLKLLWSGAAMLAILLSMLDGAPLFGWAALAIFAGFFCVWAWFLREVS